MTLEQKRIGLEPAHDVLGGVDAIDPEDQLPRPVREECPLALDHSRRVAGGFELGDVDPDRPRDHTRAAVRVLDRACNRVHIRAEQRLAGSEERPAPALGVEADHVVREQPLVNRDPRLGRQRMPVVRLRPRDVDEVGSHRVWPRFPHEARSEIEVVVVEEHLRLGLPGELVERCRGESLVDRHVTLLPRPVERGVKGRRSAKTPQIVLEEPEGRIRDDVVVGVVRLGRMRHEAKAIVGAVARGLGERALVLGGKRAVLVAHRARDPGHVMAREQAAERRDEPAAAAPCHSFAVVTAPVDDGRSIGDNEKLTPCRCRY